MKDKDNSTSKDLIYKKGLYRRYIKRPMDFILSLIALILLSPLLLITSILVRINLGSPVIFKQDRPGINGRMFSMYKFRSMTDERDRYGILLPEDMRLTKFGKFLRSTSIDELPQLFNILKGHMSLVGPRPHIARDVIFMDSKQRTRHSILPGLTGLAQISGRNRIEWDRKLQIDLEYIENITFMNDLKIILLTVVMVIKREAIAPEGMIIGEPLGIHLVREASITKEEWEYALENTDKIMKVYFKQV